MKNVNRMSIIIWILFYITACKQKSSDIVLDIKALKGKSPEAISQVLGQPDSIYYRNIYGKQYYIQEYDNTNAQLRYEHDVIAQIVLNQPVNVDFDEGEIVKFGFNHRAPDALDKEAMITWKNIEGIKTINFYLVGEKVPDNSKNRFNIYFDMK